MLGIKKAHNILDILKKFTQAGIEIHAQIVLVPNVNSGEILKNTLWDLRALGENIKSVAVVPVGITKHRKNPFPITPVSIITARETVKIVEEFYSGTPHFCFCSDEIYDIAGMPIKESSYYGNFDQVENGVGLTALFLDGIEKGLKNTSKPKYMNIAVITGMSGKKTMLRVKRRLEAAWQGFNMDVFAIKNDFFGETVTVTGLITGKDIINQLKRQNLSHYDMVYLPDCMLKEDEDVFLDNVSGKHVQKALDCPMTIVSVDGECFIDAIAGI
jgi:NifB/MoaA-like Fe-S oxidoreductase